MAKIKDRVKETTNTTGTGTITLLGAVVGYLAFSVKFANGDAIYYCVTDGTNWEVGIGTFTASGALLSRDSVIASSNADALVNFPAGSKEVFCTAPAQAIEQTANKDGSDGYAGLTLFKVNLKNAAGTITSFLASAASAARTWTMPDKDGTVAMTSDISTLANTAVTGFKTATFDSQVPIGATSGAITVDWTAAQNQLQAEPTGTITYTFTPPPGPCHLQLIIDSDGTSTAQTINLPGNVSVMGASWVPVNNKKAVLNFWFDGANYFMAGTNQV